MNIAVTGASGFLGKYVIDAALKEGLDITTIGRSKLKEIKHLDWDATRDSTINHNLNVDRLIHVAGKAHVIPKNQEERDLFFKINREGTKSLLNSFSSKPPKTLILISTIAVYGKDEGELINEDLVPEPITPYGQSKLDAESIATEWALSYDVGISILRLPLLIGDPAPGNLGQLINQIRKSKYIGMAKNKANKSMVCAKDIAKVCISELIPSGTFNLTDGVHPSFEQVEQAVKKGTNGGIKLLVPKLFLYPAAVAGSILNLAGINPPLDLLKLKKISKTLTFDDSKFRNSYPWDPQPCLDFLSKLNLENDL